MRHTMISPMLIALTETDKRVLIALCFVLIFAFILLGYIGLLIQRVMKNQGMKMDTMMHDIVITRVVSNKKQFIKCARTKNWVYFFKQAWIPLIILAVSFLIWITAQSIYEFNYNLFDTQKTGFTTLFFTFNWEDPELYTKVFGLTLLAKWPELANTPHFEVEALFSYFFLPTFLTGIIWYLILLQALIARTYKMYRLADAIYEKSLEGYNINKENMDMMKQNQANIQQMMWNQVMQKVNGIPSNNNQMMNKQNQMQQVPPPNNNPYVNNDNVVGNQNSEANKK